MATYNILERIKKGSLDPDNPITKSKNPIKIRLFCNPANSYKAYTHDQMNKSNFHCN